MRPGLVMLDVDGTLRHHGQWNPGAVQLLQLLHDARVPVALCSGRPTGSLFSVADEVPGVDLVVSSSGSTLHHRTGSGWELLGHRSLSAPVIDDALSLAQEHDIETWLFTARHWIIPRVTKATEHERQAIHAEPTVGDLQGRDDAGKFLFRLESEETLPHIRHIDSVDGVRLVRSGSLYVDLVPEVSASDKGGDLLLEHLGLTWDDVLAAGDNENDHGMLGRARTAIGVGDLDLDALGPASPGQTRHSVTDTAELNSLVRELLES